jgi:hypothetical protein
VLLFGGGNFSFTLAYVKAYSRALTEHNNVEENAADTHRNAPAPPPLKLVATSFDSQEEVQRKYPEFVQHVSKQLSTKRMKGLVSVKHAVNAVHPINCPRQVDCCIFNFPHLSTEDCSVHHCFVSHLFHALKKRGILKPQEAVMRAQDSHTHSEHPEYEVKDGKSFDLWFSSRGVLLLTLAPGQFERWGVQRAADAQGFELLRAGQEEYMSVYVCVCVFV